MPSSTFALDPDDERRLAAALFNRTWELLLKPERSIADDDEMIHAAHASRHHWGVVGKPVNFARGEWQCSRVYSVLGRAEPALHHASRCLSLATENDLGPFDIGAANEAMARAYRVAGDPDRVAIHVAAADAGRRADHRRRGPQDPRRRPRRSPPLIADSPQLHRTRGFISKSRHECGEVTPIMSEHEDATYPQAQRSRLPADARSLHAVACAAYAKPPRVARLPRIPRQRRRTVRRDHTGAAPQLPPGSASVTTSTPTPDSKTTTRYRAAPPPPCYRVAPSSPADRPPTCSACSTRRTAHPTSRSIRVPRAGSGIAPGSGCTPGRWSRRT